MIVMMSITCTRHGIRNHDDDDNDAGEEAGEGTVDDDDVDDDRYDNGHCD